VYLNAVDPLVLGSSISHWDPIAAPNLLMEPSINADLGHGVDLTLPQLRDIGWTPFVCGDGKAQSGEACDKGAQNSDTAIDACRTDCELAHCGDGVKDSGEACDDGNMAAGDGCNEACVIEFCGDAKQNNGATEACDDGVLNSDLLANACRTDCSAPRCGDAVLDSAESCDDGNAVAGDGCDANCAVEVAEPPPTLKDDAGAATPPTGGAPTDPPAVSDAGALPTDAGHDAVVDAGPGSGGRDAPDAEPPTTGSGEHADDHDGAAAPPKPDGGCGCTVPGAEAGRRAHASVGSAMLLLGFMRSRRRRRSKTYP
jgi:cysteine-rich repeat protein